MAVLEDLVNLPGNIFQGVGNAVGAVGQHLGTGLKAVRDAERTKLAAPKLRQDFEILKGQFSLEEKEAAAQRIMQTVDPKTLEKLRAGGQKAFRPTGEDRLSPFDLDRASQIGAGIAPTGSQKLAAESREKVATTRAQSKASGDNSPLGQAKETTAGLTALRNLFDAGTELTDAGEAVWLNPEFKKKYDALYTKIHGQAPPDDSQPTTDVEKNAVELGKQTVESNRTAAFGGQTGGTGATGLETPPGVSLGPSVENVGQANLPPAPENEISRQFLEQQGQTQAPQQDPRFADFFSGGTDPFQVNLQDTAPKSFADLGITSATDQEEFTQLQKMIPDTDLRQEVNKSPEDYKKLFEAIRKGRVTNKEAVELIKESLGQ